MITADRPPLDRHLATRFERDGAVVVRGAVATPWLDLLADAVEENRRHPSPWAHWYTDPTAAVGFWSDYVTWPEVAQHRMVAFDSPLASLAAELMGSTTVRFFHEHVLVKESGATEPTPWHHDQPYYCIDGEQNVSFWIALDPVSADDGVRFVAGSHRWDRWFVPRRFIDHEPYAAPTTGTPDERGISFEAVPDIDGELAVDPSRYDVLSWDVEPGDLIAFHFRTLHGAPGNASAIARRVVSLRWLGDDATFATRPWPVSPPYEAEGLVVGEPLGDDPRFPVVYRASR
jgi:ectoine hydroxylase-related dioxygenase (phytanoyl-CoA dioxygenase family)